MRGGGRGTQGDEPSALPPQEGETSGSSDTRPQRAGPIWKKSSKRITTRKGRGT